MTEDDVGIEEWLERKIWHYVRSDQRSTFSIMSIGNELIPPSNTVRDHEMRLSYPAWGQISAGDRWQLLHSVIRRLVSMHRIVPYGTEKLSYYATLKEVSVLDSLSMVIE